MFFAVRLPKEENAQCLIADTTSLNTGIQEGIFRKLEWNYKQVRDLISLECPITSMNYFQANNFELS